MLTSVAGTNTITATGPANYSYVVARTPVWFIPAVTNTAATTINITPSGGAALGAKNIFSRGAACVGGELVAGVPVDLIYDGTQFNIIGALTKTGDIDLSTGSLRGIKFDATQNTSADANTLDDYEEGTWTPTDGSGAALTFTSVSGVYTKIGNTVHATATLTYPATADASAAKIAGLPFAQSSTAGARSGGIVFAQTVNAVYCITLASSTVMEIATGVGAATTNAQMSTTTISVEATYQI